MLIAIEPNGTMKFIYNDSLRELLNEGSAQIKRASNVEPNINNTWDADMGPVGGEVLENFETRQSALDAEVKWLEKNILSK